METIVLSTPAVWMEGSALLQLERVAAQSGCVRAVGMPDLHAGLHGPIGVALAFADGIHPGLIGGDAGCGARVVALPSVRAGDLDGLERRVRRGSEETLDLDPEALLGAAWREGPAGLLAVDGVPEGLRDLAGREPADGLPPSGPVPDAHFAAQLGTTGGGNHFVEVGEVQSVQDDVLARSQGFVSGGLAVVAHSGSRGLGKVLADRWSRGPISGEALGPWLGELAGLVRYGRTNRLLLVWKILKALGAARASKIGGTFDVVHNTVVPLCLEGASVWLHRKGCAPAERGQSTVVLGSRGACSWIMVGLGNEATLSSVAHGAGRRMTRSEAVAKVRARYPRSSLTRNGLGGRVVCDDTALLYEEHPDAYKPIEPVVDALEHHHAARRLVALRPLLTVKQ